MRFKILSLITAISITFSFVFFLSFQAFKKSAFSKAFLSSNSVCNVTQILELENKTLFLGDSRVKDWSNTPPKPRSNYYFIGVNGQTSLELRNSLDCWVFRGKKKTVFIQIGINDIKLINFYPHLRAQIVRNLKVNLFMVLNRLVNYGFTVHVTTVLRISRYFDGAHCLWSQQASSAINEVMANILSLFLPINTLDIGFFIVSKDKIKSAYRRDSLHLNARAYNN